MDYMATQLMATKGFIRIKTECFTLNKPREAQINVSTLGAVTLTHTMVKGLSRGKFADRLR